MQGLVARLRSWQRQRVLRRAALPEPLWRRTIEALPLLHGLDDTELQRLRELATLFLHHKEIHSVADLAVDEAMRVTLAAQAALPILNLGIDWYRGWTTIVLYPGDFIARHRYRDELGLEHEEEAAMAGEAWEQGPVVLSWADVADSGRLDGFNVVIHEFAHKLDMLNGEPNGYPPLHRDMRADDWAEAFSKAFADLEARIERGDESLPLDPYAAEEPAEFFSVASEAFFELPGNLRQDYPEVYRQLAAFYRQDPAARLSGRPGWL